MIKILFAITMLNLTGLVQYAQLTKGPDGKDLYQKGVCKTIMPNVKYKCVFCEDKELTKNCKEYDCSLTECTESKSIKGSDGRLLSKPIAIQGKQIRIQDDSTGRTPHSSIDLTEHFNNRKVKNGTVLIYQGEKKMKVYATYKSGKLIEWYAMGEDGKKIKSSQVALTSTTCEDCVILPNGTTICKKCTITPGVVLPVKRAD